ncbi:MAG: hypothetical protein IT427_11245 [Pirellulales bacterium]|nr:hypothetical protein [Pirellulales bacterium]
MAFRSIIAAGSLVLAGIVSRAVLAQAPPAAIPPENGVNWRPPVAGSAAGGPVQSDPSGPRTPIAKVTTGNGTLPNDSGQVWREYDITPYTLRVTTTTRPEQAIVDWILRETGYEAWHSDPVGLLSANGRVLRVYHTPQMQDTVAEIVDRFINTQAETQAFGMRLITLSSPNWRSKLHRALRPIPVQSPGVQAWIVSKEDAALVIAELQKRSDFREHSSPHLLVQNGQATVVSASRPKNYIKDVTLNPQVWPGFAPETAVLDEGYSLEFKPLISIDGNAIDGVIKCNIDQIEKMVDVPIDVPTATAPRQKTTIQVPRTSSHRFAEKFHWPINMVLVIGFGVVPTPTPTESSGIRVPGLTPPDHADLLVFIENRGVIRPPVAAPPAVTTTLPPSNVIRPF